MAFNENQSIVAEYYVAALGRLPDQTGFNFWVGQLDSGMTPESLMNKFFDSSFPEVAARYPEGQTSEETIQSIYKNVFGRDADAGGLAFWSEKLDSSTKPAILAQMLAIAKDPANVVDGDYLKAQKAKAEAQLNADLSGDGETKFLSVSQDMLDGTSSNDAFKAYVAQNDNGQQVNTLGSGDVINGGSGTDTLDAQVTAGAFVNGTASSNMAVAPVTTSVENIVLHAEIANIAGYGNNDEVIVNAKYTTGVKKIASNYSDASLLLQNVNTKGVSGGTSSQTIAMEYSGNNDTMWDESDMTVFYDQDYLVRNNIETNSLYYFTQDRLATDLTGKPFGVNTAVDGIRFRVDEKTEVVVKIAQDKLNAFLNNVPSNNLAAYQKFADLLSEALALKNTEMNGALDGFTIELDRDFFRTNGGKNDGGDPLNQVAYAVVLTAPDNVKIDQPAMHQNTKFLGTYDMFNDIDSTGREINKPVSINVDLEKVGLAADGGALTIGSMNKDHNNMFNEKQAITVTDTIAGFDEFNVHVAGDKSKNSSLASMHSTDNTLRKVTIDSKADGDANLTIGNSNTPTFDDFDGDMHDSTSNALAFKDVQIMDANTFKGDLSLKAGFTSDIVAKYLDNVTETTLYGLNDAAKELADFDYKGGDGDDTLDLALDLENFAVGNFANAEGTNGQNVFKMNVNAGKGEDTIILDADNADFTRNDTNTTVYSATNITANGGLGDDLINISSNANGWTYNIAFSGKHFGHDTVQGFNVGQVELTDEKQTLDLTGFIAHKGETVTVSVGNQKMTFTAAGTMDDDAIASKVADMLDGSDAKFNKAKFDTASDANAVITLEDKDTNVNSVKVEVNSQREKTGTYDKDTTPIHSATSVTTEQGGLVKATTDTVFSTSQTSSETNGVGADTLDFSAYNVKGVVIGLKGEADTFGTDAGKIANGSSNIFSKAGNKFVYLEEASHDSTIYNAYLATSKQASNVQDVDFGKGGNATKGAIIGSVNLDQNTDGLAVDYSQIDASQLLF